MRRNNMPRGHRANANASTPNDVKLQGLDLELELLQRKRDMIEHQQQLLANERQRQYGYNQPHQNYQQQQYDNNQSYSDYYNQSYYSNHSGSSLLGKRSSNSSEWHSQPKRFSGAQRAGGKKRFGSGVNSDSKPKPLLDQMIIPPFPMNSQIDIWNNAPASINAKGSSRRTEYKAPRSFSREFKPKKVNKNKQPPSATVPKLVSYPIPQRKQLIEEASQMVKEVDKTSEFILHADKVPTQQTAGRLELALGSIMKTIKKNFGETEEHIMSFQSQFLLRQMKHAIRERLRRVMLGKYVGKLDDIVKEYRKVFPEETDSEIMQIALEARKDVDKKQLAIKIEDADTPESYFKLNMHKLLTLVLDEMFEKLQNMYSAESTENIKAEYKDILMENDDFTEDVTLDTNAANSTEVPTEKNTEQTSNEEAKTEESNKDEINSEDVKSNAPAEEKQEEIVEKQEDITDEQQDITEEQQNIPESQEDIAEKQQDLAETQQDAAENQENQAEKQIDGTENNIDEKQNGNENKDDEQAKQVSIRFRRLDNLLVTMLKRRLPTFLTKYKENIIKILNLTSMYESTKNFITSKAQDKLRISSHMQQSRKFERNNAGRNKSGTPATKPERVFPYYVKIIGRPELPKRKEMQSFLQKFGPKSVKKHKTMELLFVGFAKKENYERVLEVKQSVIGENTITIINEKADMNDTSDSDVQIIENMRVDDEIQVIEDEERLNTSDVINSDLDDQINDLLSSIRNEEEKVDNTTDVEQSTKDEGEQNVEDLVALPDKATEVNTEAVGEDIVVNVDQGKRETNKAVIVINDNDEKGTEASVDKNEEAKDNVAALKNDAQEQPKGTPTRISARLASVTPSTIRTRRSSKLAQN